MSASDMQQPRSGQRTFDGALIGCGFARNHLHAWREVEGARIVALCDADEARLRAAGREFGIERLYTDAATMLQAERPDFVDIATTAASHRALVEMAASARVAAICQKPFAPTLDDARAMVDACREARVPLMVHENFRWQNALQAAGAALREGAIGKPFWDACRFAPPSTCSAGSRIWRRTSASLSKTSAFTFSTSRAFCLATCRV
ncbi:Gfo/Idh/MocA family protein [Paraburkholderia kirstenboschensis]|uniref:Gfo/Idh/MocA family protein n=1 Tax=Paraburkholderia kirstenboschensis TaxID=1245436 RepID=UPI000AF14E7A|nr:Gfo/Idh/MocA family oxidoreductase [Paraburkholderia kirstenboschensis]